jgi:hypothetical protein
MFDRVGSLAERVATDVSRRAFLGRLGQSALVLAGIAGSLLILPEKAWAKQSRCVYFCPDGSYYTYGSCPSGTGCAPSVQHSGMTCLFDGCTSQPRPG